MMQEVLRREGMLSQLKTWRGNGDGEDNNGAT